ncbi:hypothetical protein [Nostoc sp.]
MPKQSVGVARRRHCTHSSTTGDRFVFEVFCKAIPTVSYANALW